jgi:hypothetical protein
MQHKIFRLIVDSGHAWLEVDLKELPQAEQFAEGYGYQDLNLIYLEEDSEMPRFLNYWTLLGNTYTLDEWTINGEWRGRWMYPHNKAHATA